MSIDEAALRELADLTGVVLGHTDLPSALVEICRITVRSVPGANGASVTTFPEGRPGAVASDEWAQSLDEMQYAEHEGPCLDAYRTGNLFRVRDLASEQRWPSYSPRAAERGARSMVSLPMSAQGSVIGALNVYSREADSFDAETVSLAEVVAAYAGMASEVSAAFFRHRDLAANLALAMESRATIEQAKGALMALRRVDSDAAFDELVALSQNRHEKLRDVAARIVDAVSKPDGPLDI